MNTILRTPGFITFRPPLACSHSSQREDFAEYRRKEGEGEPPFFGGKVERGVGSDGGKRVKLPEEVVQGLCRGQDY